MNIILDAIRCVNCINVLNSPVLLPCGHSICKSHTHNTTELIYCYKCGVENAIPNGNFPPNTALEQIINAQIGKLDFGDEYKLAKLSCNHLDQLLTKIENTINEPSYFTDEVIDDLRLRVKSKGDQMKLKIDEQMNSLFRRLDCYKEECNKFARTNACLAVKLRNLRRESEEARKRLVNCQNSLNELKFNEPRWKRIKSANENAIEAFHIKLDRLKTDLLLQNVYGDIKHEISCYNNVLGNLTLIKCSN